MAKESKINNSGRCEFYGEYRTPVERFKIKYIYYYESNSSILNSIIYS